MPHPARLLPALAGFLILGLMLIGERAPADNVCRIARAPAWLEQQCLSVPHLPLAAGAAAIALIALTLLLLLRWQRSRRRAISYESDAGRWIVLGWILAIAGAISLLAGLLLIGSGGWPFSQQSRHITIRTGQLPVFISTVQRRYFASYAGADGLASLCAGFGAVTIHNRSRSRHVALDLGLLITPRKTGGPAAMAAMPTAAMPGREDLAAIARRGLAAQAIFCNPVELKPRESLQRELVFVIRDAAAGLSDRDHDFALAVTDRLSGQRVSFPLPAEYRG
ncbi:MAG: hypothetical protein AB7V13_19185 [Pseudorhodoplanes sp.]|uniref:hypothetical protein n=1 Tax=Pseudorhodoplanes sp. TaxID=1934341 RepID=UPI003D12CE00